jgi:hypothetical protein
MPIGFVVTDTNTYFFSDTGARYSVVPGSFTSTSAFTATLRLQAAGSPVSGAVAVQDALFYTGGKCYTVAGVNFSTLLVNLTVAGAPAVIGFSSSVGAKSLFATGTDARGAYAEHTRKNLSFDLAGAPYLPDNQVPLVQNSTDGTVVQVPTGGSTIVRIHNGDVFVG